MHTTSSLETYSITYRVIRLSKGKWNSVYLEQYSYFQATKVPLKMLKYILSINRQVAESHVFSKWKMSFSGVQLGAVTSVSTATFLSFTSSQNFFLNIFIIYYLISNGQKPIGGLLSLSNYTNNKYISTEHDVVATI